MYSYGSIHNQMFPEASTNRCASDHFCRKTIEKSNFSLSGIQLKSMFYKNDVRKSPFQKFADDSSITKQNKKYSNLKYQDLASNSSFIVQMSFYFGETA